MEAELSVFTSDPGGSRDPGGHLVLTHQLQHLLVCVDVYLETAEPKPATSDFRLDRICSRLTRSVCRDYANCSELRSSCR